MSKIALFLDLDETLVRTTYLDGATELFVDGNYRTRNKARVKEYYAAVNACRQGDCSELQRLADKRGVKLVEFEGLDEPRVTVLRPGAHQFLSWARNAVDELNICTSGRTDFQTLILQLTGIDHYFDNIYGRQEINDAAWGDDKLTPKGYYPILVDDNDHPGTMGWNSKMMALGAISAATPDSEAAYQRVNRDHCIGIKYFHGDPEDAELEKVKLQLQELIARKNLRPNPYDDYCEHCDEIYFCEKCGYELCDCVDCEC